MEEKKEISIIGLGGIGSILSNTISRYLNSKKSNELFTINLVDGDSYELKNTERQEFIMFGNKAETKASELTNKFSNLIFKDYPVFVDEETIPEIIKENSIVFLAVDNHKTRKVVSDFAEKLNDITVISGGNELTDGNVQIFIRKEGKKLTPNLTEYHPEIADPKDKSPDEMSCEELSKSEPQLYFTNFMVASQMCSAFYNVFEMNNYKISEVYFDILTMNSNSKIRIPKEKNNTI